MELMEKERLLTESEKRYIIGAIEKRDIKLGIAIYGIMLFFLSVLCFSFITLDGMVSAIIIFFVVNIGVLLMLHNTWNTASKLAEAVKRNEIYVREAIYVSASMNRYGNFKIRKNGRMQSYLPNAFLLEKFNREDKVILIQMGKNYVWVYKAREDEIMTN